MFLAAIVVLILGNTLVGIYQWQIDEGFAFLRSERSDTAGISGFYYHRNYLAGFCEIACPVLFAASLSRTTWLGRLGVALPLVLGVGICFLSNSRGGFGVMVLACLVVYFLESLRTRKKNSRQTKSEALRPLVVTVVLVVLGLVGRYCWLAIFENRGGTGGAEGSLLGRLKMAGLAFDIWLESPLWGMGAESYSYLFPRFFAGLPGWLGDAQMAHSDYLQLLTDYGAVGLIAVVLLIGGMAFLVLRRIDFGTENFDEQECGVLWLRSAAAGALVAEVLRATLDFNLHVAPNLIVFAMVVAGGGSCYQDLVGKVVKNGKSVLKLDPLSRGLAVVMAIGAGGYGIWAGENEILAARDWAAIEVLRQRGENDEVALRRFSEKAPSFRVLRRVAQNSFDDALESADGSDFIQTSEDWRRLVEIHPLDGESLANYARCLDEMKMFEKAENYHARALEAVARRENHYGVIHGVGWHLVRRANENARARRPGEALFLYLSAKEVFEESRQRGFSRTRHNRDALKWVEKRIEFLEGARIEPESVDVLDWKSKLL
ncbi:MAG: O-antigen ligase family protein [Roseibacillus sp.]